MTNFHPPRIIAVTGTNGKTTTTRLISFILAENNQKVGYTCSDGIYFENEEIAKGDCSGPRSARTLMQSGQLDYAILECARGGMLREGLAFEKSDAAVITNVAEDHIGLKGINSLEEMGELKFRVAETVKEDGIIVLNGDDPVVRKMAEKIEREIIFFSVEQDQDLIDMTLEKGNAIVRVNQQKFIEYINPDGSFLIENIENIPAAFGGKARFMVRNILAAVAIAISQGVQENVIRQALVNFDCSFHKNPGRMNFFSFPKCTVIVDYVHNIHGYEEIGEFLSHYDQYKIGIFSAPGDRRDQDITGIGKKCGEIFDEVIIRLDRDTRTRTGDQIIELLTEGVRSSDPEKKINVIRAMDDAIDFAIENCPENSIIFLSASNIRGAIEYMQILQDELTIAPDLRDTVSGK